ncbi:MAG: 3-deoxy-8-phosphooctulonate synthase [Desulfonauticus sp.]|nr:3-deoxy-8-phosphooctulonate synthase [Desulfonauticus sp.]
MDLFAKSKEKLFFIAGPCVLESRELALKVADELATMAQKLDVLLIFKSSFDKANRTSLQSFRGPGLEQGLRWLEDIKLSTGLPVLTDYHLPEQASLVAEVVDVLQVPAFLCRQTDLLLAGARTGKLINLKKGQFMAPWDVKEAVLKIESGGNQQIWLTERGVCFGYNNLVVDMRSFSIMQKQTSYPVIFDATHSVQLPGGKGKCSDGQREFVPYLAQAAVAAGASGVFMEVHPDPDQALCDGANSWPLSRTFSLMQKLLEIWSVVYEGT